MVYWDHSEYIDKIKNVTIDPKRSSENNEPLNEREQTLFRQIIGQLNWAVQGSRPDSAFDMIAMSTNLKQGKVGDLVRAIKKICRLKDIRSYITFPELDKMKELKMVVFMKTCSCLGHNFVLYGGMDGWMFELFIDAQP